MELLLIAAVVAIIFLVSNKKKANLAAYESDKLASEIIDLLRGVRSFLKVNQFEGNFLVMLIPSNHGRELYAADSCKVQISIFLHDDQILMLKSRDELNTQKHQWYGQQFFDKRFYFSNDLDKSPIGIQQCGNQAFYMSYSSTFSSEYKRLMKALNPKITAAFPDVQWQFDGSRISTNQFHQ